MRLFEYVREAFEALMRNKTRTILTMVGMFIGVGAVDAVYALSVGAAAAIAKDVSSGDQPSLIIAPDTRGKSVGARLSYRDAAEVSALGADIERAVPSYSAFTSPTLHRVTVTMPAGQKPLVAWGFSWYGDDENMIMDSGVTFTAAQVDAAENVVLLDPDLAYAIFKSEDDAVGKDVILSGKHFRVIGVINKNKGSASNYMGGTYYYVLPYSTFHQFAPGDIDQLMVWTPSQNVDHDADQTVKRYLSRAHGPLAAYTTDFTREDFGTVERVVTILAAGLTAIGAISLLVAGIGIMNIMLVTVTERTREIGIRKSIGARRSDVVLQFLIEAILMSTIGGFFGLLLALGVVGLAAGVLSDKFGSFVIPYLSVVGLAFGFSFLVGLTFGTYPAIRASRLDPIEALRS